VVSGQLLVFGFQKVLLAKSEENFYWKPVIISKIEILFSE